MNGSFSRNRALKKPVGPKPPAVYSIGAQCVTIRRRKRNSVDVTGAESNVAAKRIALSIANSPLVKTAIAGADANWGRVVMAVGKAGEAADRDTLKISFGGHVVAEKGQRAAKYNEKLATKAVSGREVEIAVELGLGTGVARVWTCDLTHGYIDINGSYRS